VIDENDVGAVADELADACLNAIHRLDRSLMQHHEFDGSDFRKCLICKMHRDGLIADLTRVHGLLERLELLRGVVTLHDGFTDSDDL
jgi:hypothetical protein